MLYSNCDRNIKFNNYGFAEVSNSFVRRVFLKLWYYGPIPRSDVILKLDQKRPKFVSTIGQIRSKPLGNEALRWGKCLWGKLQNF